MLHTRQLCEYQIHFKSEKLNDKEEENSTKDSKDTNDLSETNQVFCFVELLHSIELERDAVSFIPLGTIIYL